MLTKGRNFWRIAHADRVAVLIDGAAYFSAFRTAVQRATQSVLVVGWDIDSRIALQAEEPTDGYPARLGDFLDAVVAHKPKLEANILIWDFAVIYAMEREVLPLLKLQWSTHPRLRFYMDDRHPFGSSHHQKIVVMDDALAFVGGLDLTKCRWDTPEHRADEPARVNVDGAPYPPFHDVQLMVEGELAGALGDLARRRWRNATSETLRPPDSPGQDIWPKDMESDFQDLDVAIVRTEPAHDGRAEVREVEQLYLDAIAAARRSIYVENQYFSSVAVGKALSLRLREAEGPEVVLVLPRATSGWLEQATMDVLRARLLQELRASDRHDRLRVFFPDGPGLDECHCITVHAKVMVVDDALLRVGSSNLSNRSMGLDSECDLAIAANSRPEVAGAIAHARNRLLAEHLGTTVGQVAAALSEKRSLIAAVESLRGGERTLQDLDGRVSAELDAVIPEAAVVDPEKPLDVDAWVTGALSSDQDSETPGHGTLKIVAALGAVVALAAMWRWSPLAEWLSFEHLAGFAHGLRGNVFGPLIVLGAFVVGSLLAFPIAILILATLLVFDPALGFACALSGTLLGAALTYAAGHKLGRNTIRRIAGERLNELSRRLSRRGVLAVATLRLVPVAPFTIVNLVAGASHIRFRDFMLGSLFGLGPGILGLTVFADSLFQALRNPEPSTVAWVVVVVIVVGLAAFGIRAWIQRREADTSGRADPQA